MAENVIRRLGGELVDVAIIFTPSEAVEQATMDAMAYIKPGGLINFVSAANPSVVSLKSGDLNVQDLRRRNHSGVPTAGYFEEFRTLDRKVVRVTGQRGTSTVHIQASISLLIEDPRPFKKLITDVVQLDEAAAAISSTVDWSLGRGEGIRPMKTVFELNWESI